MAPWRGRWLGLTIIVAVLTAVRAQLLNTVRPIDIVQSFAQLSHIPGVAQLIGHRNTLQQPPPLVMEVGFREGRNARFFANRGYTVVGVDLDPRWVIRSRDLLWELHEQYKLLVIHAGIEQEPVDKSLLYYHNTKVPSLSSFDKQRACSDDEQCEAIHVPLLRCEALFVFGQPEHFKVHLDNNTAACLRALANVPRAMLPRYVSWEMTDAPAGGPAVDMHLVVLLWELGYSQVKVLPQEAGERVAGLAEEFGNYLTLGSHWSPVEELLRKGLVSPKDLFITRRDRKRRGKSTTFKASFGFHMKLNTER